MLKQTREGNYAEWCQAVIAASDMAENSVSPGCMIIKPWACGIWNNIKGSLDKMFAETGHENYYFPMFIPLHFFQKEADHVEGFAKEMALVTHSKLRQDENGKLIPDGKLEEPLVIRPTSETIIADAFAKWINSYRDLPILLNQWANVVRWEMRPRLFLRTREFLWQEGHTAHATAEEAGLEAHQMIQVYHKLAEEFLAMPVLMGRKPEHEKFPGAVETLSIEAMMQDGKALQAGTSHYLGQNFAKSANIMFQNKEGKQEYVHTTSWGVSTRLIGGVIMTHADDEGMNTPPRIAPYQVVFIPMIKSEDTRAALVRYTDKLNKALSEKRAFGESIRTKIDLRNKESVDKYWEWARRGVPLIVEVGMRDVEGEKVMVKIRNRIGTPAAKQLLTFTEFVNTCGSLLEEIQAEMFAKAKKRMLDNIVTDVKTFADLQEVFKDSNGWLGDNVKSSRPGFVLAKWSEEPESLEKLKELKVTMRCFPFDMQDDVEGTCILTGKPAKKNIILGRAY